MVAAWRRLPRLLPGSPRCWCDGGDEVMILMMRGRDEVKHVHPLSLFSSCVIMRRLLLTFTL